MWKSELSLHTEMLVCFYQVCWLQLLQLQVRPPTPEPLSLWKNLRRIKRIRSVQFSYWSATWKQPDMKWGEINSDSADMITSNQKKRKSLELNKQEVMTITLTSCLFESPRHHKNTEKQVMDPIDQIDQSDKSRKCLEKSFTWDIIAVRLRLRRKTLKVNKYINYT